MARSILFSIMFIAGALGVVIFSAAQFTDAETTQTQAVTAGTIDLGIQAQLSCPVTAPPGLGGAPEDPAASTSTCTFTLQNVGSLSNGDLYAMIEFDHIACTNSAGGGLNDGSEYCNATGDLAETEFDVTAASLSGGSLVANSNFTTTPVGLDAYLASCQPIASAIPIDTNMVGSFTVELQQDETTNVMQGDALEILLHFELVENGGAPANCILDDPATGGPGTAP